MNHGQRRGIVTVLGLALVLVGAPLPAQATAPPPVDESRLVPLLSSGFAPWTCQTKQDGPVCKGERHVSRGWVPFDFACGDTPLWARGESDRYQTRYYNAGLPRLLPRVPHQRHRLPQHLAHRAGDGDDQHERPIQ